MKPTSSALSLHTEFLPGPAHLWAPALEAIGRGYLQAAALLSGRAAPGSAPVAQSLGKVCPAEGQTWLTVLDLVNEFLKTRARKGLCDRYLKQLRVTLGSFTQGRARRVIDQVSRDDVQDWINSHDWAPKTCRGYLADLRGMFTFAVRRGYLAKNPAEAIELPPMDNTTPIEVHTPEQVSQVLEFARRAHPDVCRILALRYFAGIRSQESKRLREEDLKIAQGFIEVPAAKAKTRSRRLVTIQPNLKAWLELGGELRPIGDMMIRKVVRMSNVPSPHNVARHSFVSYHLAQFKKLNETVLESGHSEAMLFKHYRALVSPEAAAAYWGIVPAGVSAKTGAAVPSAKADAADLSA